VEKRTADTAGVSTRYEVNYNLSKIRFFVKNRFCSSSLPIIGQYCSRTWERGKCIATSPSPKPSPPRLG
jgi:hypothetical protein